MATLILNGYPDETRVFDAQFSARPVGFGLFNTFYPAAEATVAWREKHWGTSVDKGIASMPNSSALRSGALTGFSSKRDLSVLQRIASLFPGITFQLHSTEYETVAPMTLREKPPFPEKLPEVLQSRWHRCIHCNKKFRRHAEGKCLFDATRFTPPCLQWRTIYGDYIWQTNSTSYVPMASNTTTKTTTSLNVAALTP